MRGEILITVGDVSDVEAHVYARYSGPFAQQRNAGETERVLVQGRLRGPFCETARTLPADIPFRDLESGDVSAARAIVSDPCLWSPDLPHLYQVDVEARQSGQLVAEYHGKIGLRRK